MRSVELFAILGFDNVNEYRQANSILNNNALFLTFYHAEE